MITEEHIVFYVVKPTSGIWFGYYEGNTKNYDGWELVEKIAEVQKEVMESLTRNPKP